MGDDIDLEGGVFNPVDSQGNAVEGDRSLGRDETGERLGRAQGQTLGISLGVARLKLGDAIHMAEHHMAAELIAERQRPFEIDPDADPPGAQGGPGQGLGRDIEGQPIGILFDHRQADPRTGHGGADGDARNRVSRGDHQALAAPAFDRPQFPPVADDSRKHGRELKLSARKFPRGWHKGISSDVRLVAMMPARRATSNTSPLATRLSRMSAKVSGRMVTVPPARACRRVMSFAPTSTIRLAPCSSKWESSDMRPIQLRQKGKNANIEMPVHYRQAVFNRQPPGESRVES